MSTAALTWLLKRILIYIVVVLVLLPYIITISLDQKSAPLIWRTVDEHLLPNNPENRTNPPDIKCRNSVQGRDLLVDDRGFVCEIFNILPNGCCNVQHASTKYYTCDSCQPESHCCSIYEYCVSCCLHPAKRPLLELALEVIQGHQAMIYAQVADQYELCIAKCRTNSHLVQNEKLYRDPEHHFCYGLTTAHVSQLEVSR